MKTKIKEGFDTYTTFAKKLTGLTASFAKKNCYQFHCWYFAEGRRNWHPKLNGKSVAKIMSMPIEELTAVPKSEHVELKTLEQEVEDYISCLKTTGVGSGQADALKEKYWEWHTLKISQLRTDAGRK